MTKKEENKMTMYAGVISVAHENESVIEKVPALKEAFKSFADATEQIEKHDRMYKSVSAGSTAAKSTAAEDLIERAMPVANALYVYGRKSNNEQLKSECGLFESHFRKVRDTELAQKVSRILELVAAHKEALVQFGVTDEQIRSLDQAAARYRELLGRKEEKHAEAKVSREALFDAFDRADDILREDVDSLMELVKAGNPDFYNRYYAARMIRDLGFVKRKAEEAQEQPA